MKQKKKKVSEANYHTTTHFRKFFDNRNDKMIVKMNKTIYLDMSILDISKTLMFEFWYDYIKPKYGV